MLYGPMSLLVVGFPSDDQFKGQIRSELIALRKSGTVRLIDAIFVRKQQSGALQVVQGSDLTDWERVEFGAVIGGLIGLGAGGEAGAEAGIIAGAEAFAEREFGLSLSEIQDIADQIPRGSAVLILLIEHLWAKKFKEALIDTGGVVLAQGPVRPEALVEFGAELAAAIEAADEYAELE